ASEAIVYNSPVYHAAYIFQQFQNYPASYLPLDTGKSYAWQVIARNSHQYSAQTEVWTFHVAGQQPPTDKQHSVVYTQMRNNSAFSTVQLNERRIYIRHYSNRGKYTARFEILDAG